MKTIDDPCNNETQCPQVEEVTQCIEPSPVLLWTVLKVPVGQMQSNTLEGGSNSKDFVDPSVRNKPSSDLTIRAVYEFVDLRGLV